MIADKVVICQLMGLSYALYNIVTGNPYLQEQYELNAAVMLIYD